eukprot:TRINITY_DN44809_c0_g1_i1.p1 TRINITY_DN44809_c0_g1~~TRINITY_DN44809_c0_g1_i1.p1  ORF type:complete len:458 (+),score=26.29 TRINITY_DN44809_c0_g1_i1:120-1376(+)
MDVSWRSFGPRRCQRTLYRSRTNETGAIFGSVGFGRREVALLLASFVGRVACWHPSAAHYTLRVFSELAVVTNQTCGPWRRLPDMDIQGFGDMQLRDGDLEACQIHCCKEVFCHAVKYSQSMELCLLYDKRTPIVQTMQSFMDFSLYVKGTFVKNRHRRDSLSVLEVGSQNVNGGMFKYVPPGWRYVGVDIRAGPGVDVVLKDPYQLPFPDGYFDLVASVSALEHCDFYFLLFQEMVRVSRGFIYINVPSDQPDHSAQVSPDSWRFLADSAGSLLRWSHRNGQNSLRLSQSFVAPAAPEVQPHRDTVMLFSVTEKDLRIDEEILNNYDILFRNLLLSNRCWARANASDISKTILRHEVHSDQIEEMAAWNYCCSVYWSVNKDEITSMDPSVQKIISMEAETVCNALPTWIDWRTCCTV